MIKILFIFITIIHGLIHLMGFFKAFNLAKISQLSQSITKPMGILWLISAILFLVISIVILLKKEWWWMLAGLAILLSQFLIFITWKDAKYGTIANLIIFIGIIVGFGIWNFNLMVKNELKDFINNTAYEKKIVTKEMLNHLPTIIQKWMNQSGVVGKELFVNIYLKQTGKMRTTPDGMWMSVNAEQWFKTKQPGFLWITNVQIFPGVFLFGRDKYESGKGHMLIKLFSLIPVADAKGSKIDQGTMLRYLAEMIWFPNAALQKYINWQQIDDISAKATMTHHNISISGIFKFNSNGDVESFQAKRYYTHKNEEATLEDWFIQIEPNSYKSFEGIRIPTKANVTWKLKEGNFTWYKLEITQIHYNSIKNNKQSIIRL